MPACESEAYVWAMLQPDGKMQLYFAVENPSGISAKALATMLTKTLSGLTPAEIATVSPEIVERLFRQNISMGKGMGLMSMVGAVRTLAQRAQGIESKPAAGGGILGVAALPPRTGGGSTAHVPPRRGCLHRRLSGPRSRYLAAPVGRLAVT